MATRSEEVFEMRQAFHDLRREREIRRQAIQERHYSLARKELEEEMEPLEAGFLGMLREAVAEGWTAGDLRDEVFKSADQWDKWRKKAGIPAGAAGRKTVSNKGEKKW